MERVDAVIIGAGFAGLAAACQLGGRRVLVLERHPSVVDKQRGSLGLYVPLGDPIEVSFDDLKLTRPDLLIENGVRDRIHHLEIVGQRERYRCALRTPWLVLDERRIKGALLRKAIEGGVEVRVGTPVREVIPEGKEIRVRADIDTTAQVVIGADGSLSLVGGILEPRRVKTAVLFQRETELSRLDLKPATLHLQLEDRGQLFTAMPYGDRSLAAAFHVLGPRGIPVDLEQRLADRVERLGGGKRITSRSAVVRTHAPATQSHRDGLVLTGDALATYSIASIGGALTMGSMAGEAAQRVLAGSHYALPDYHHRIRRVGAERWVTPLGLLLPLMARINAERIDRVIKLLRGKDERMFAFVPALLRMLV